MTKHQNKVTTWYEMRFLVFVLLSVFLVSGCNTEPITVPIQEIYKEFGSNGGLHLETLSSWESSFNDRNSTITVTNKRGTSEGSAVIIIQPFTTIAHDIATAAPLVEHLESATTIISSRHDLDMITIVQAPEVSINEAYEMATTVVQIPVELSDEDGQFSDLFQTIELHAIRCGENFSIIYFYRSKNDQLNKEANDIIKSIELHCPEK